LIQLNRGKSIAIPLILLGLIVVPLFLTTYSLNLLTLILIFGIFAASLDLLVGYTGLYSLGHAAFWGTGAYIIGILSTRGLVTSFLPLFLMAILAVAIVATIFGALATKVTGIYFLMITFCFNQVLFFIAWKWRAVTRGDDGIPGIVRPDLGLSLNLGDELNFYYFCLLFFLASAWAMVRITESPFCKALVGIRDSESRMQTLGFPTRMFKWVCFVVSGLFAGVAGILSAYYNGFVSPLDLSLVLSGEGLIMNIIGGVGTLWGPIVGAAVITLLKHLVSGYTVHWPLIVGGIFILVVMFARGGIAGALKERWKL
jgi:branched-chain amino acid transport system permease protein